MSNNFNPSFEKNLKELIKHQVCIGSISTTLMNTSKHVNKLKNQGFYEYNDEDLLNLKGNLYSLATQLEDENAREKWWKELLSLKI